MNKTIVIAEAGVNHNGNINIAKKLIDVAADAEADYVKFQTFKAERTVTQKASKAQYQIVNSGNAESHFEMLRRLELDKESHLILIGYCSKKGIKFLSTPFDIESIEMLDDLGLEVFKIPSGEITNLPFLKKISTYNKEIIMSTGMSSLKEIGLALDIILNHGTEKGKITVLHCNSEYPTPMEDVNLKAMNTIGAKFGIKVGYSDHTLGLTVPIAAVSLGACVIEKHFTLDKNMEGPDHKASLEPLELKEMVSQIRLVEQILGNGVKEPSKSEQKNIAIVRKSIHLTKDLKKGHQLSEDDLIMKRPGDGISPMEVDEVLSKGLKLDLLAEHKLSYEDLNL